MSDTWAEKASLTGCGASCLANQGADWQEAQNWEVGKEEMELFCDLGKGGVYYFSDKRVYRHNMTGDSVGVGWLKGVKKDDEDEDGIMDSLHLFTV